MGASSSNAAGPAIGEPPSWVEDIEKPDSSPTSPADHTYGYDYLLLHQHVNAAEEATYFHNVYRITSEGALQSGARLTWSFDPSYEQLTFHHLVVWRGDDVQNRLKPEAITTIQQERDLDRHMLNGHLTALVMLDDIRVGDVVDYAFTRKGWNPTFAGKYFDSLSTAWGVPIRRQRFRLDVPSERTIFFRPQGESVPIPTKRTVGGSTTYLWDERALPVIRVEGEGPSWYSPFPILQWSEFDDWAQVVDWALPHYEVAEPIAPPVQTKAEELVRGIDGDAAKAVALLHFVQQEIRYLGIELGAGSYRPSPSAVVLARRFGDCKDKTLLFCTLMRAIGLKAFPALLHTELGARVDQRLPSPHAFDHVIACIPSGKGFYWVDPTLTYQQGPLGCRGLPDYGRALIIRAGEMALTAINPPAGAQRSIIVTERIDVTSFDQPARFEVITRAMGLSADSTRAYFARNTAEEITKQYVNYYASVYPGLVSTKPVTWSDDPAQNIFTTVEGYDIPDLWKKASDGSLKAEFFPRSISDCAVRPQTTVRSTPLGVGHPNAVQLTTTVYLPEKWTIKDEDEAFVGEAFLGRVAISGKGPVVTMHYEWKTRADHVAAKNVAEHMKELNKFRDALGYSLTYRSQGSRELGNTMVGSGRPFRLNWLLVLVSLVTAAAAASAARRVYRIKSSVPPPSPAERETWLVGLGGWLVLVGIGVTLRPLVLLVGGFTNTRHTFDQDVWESLTLPGGTAYQPAFGALLIGETIANIVQVVLSILLVVLFYGKRRTFPGVFVFTICFSLMVVVLDGALGGILVQGVEFDTKSFVQTVGQAAIWIPYMLMSRRVKLTFTR